VGVVLRVVAALAVCVLPFVYAVPAAHADPIVSPNECPTEPPADAPPGWVPDNCTPADGTIMQGARTVTFNVNKGTNTLDGNVLEVVAELESETDNVPDPGPVELTCPNTDRKANVNGCQFEEGDNVTSGTYSFVWDAASLTPYNGAFTLHVDATARRGLSSTRTTPFDRGNLRVDNQRHARMGKGGRARRAVVHVVPRGDGEQGQEAVGRHFQGRPFFGQQCGSRRQPRARRVLVQGPRHP
jgi:hypothetical protein